jgi:hypothetical protein
MLIAGATIMLVGVIFGYVFGTSKAVESIIKDDE